MSVAVDSGRSHTSTALSVLLMFRWQFQCE